MANIFKKQQEVNNHPKRNNFDLSFQNHSTFKFGKIYPVFCKEVVPGDSFRIKSAFGLKFMPMVFPVQSKMRACMHFYYVRNKNLWDRWEDWISGLKGSADGVEFPYIDATADKFRTGSLLDYMNVPTTISDNSSYDTVFFPLRNGYLYNNRGLLDIIVEPWSNPPAGVTSLGLSPMPSPIIHDTSERWRDFINVLKYDDIIDNGVSVRKSFAFLSGEEYDIGDSFIYKISSTKYSLSYSSCNATLLFFRWSSDESAYKLVLDEPLSFTEDDNTIISQGTLGTWEGRYKVAVAFDVNNAQIGTDSFSGLPFAIDSFYFNAVDVSVNDAVATPFADSTNGIRLSALPFRAVESIYNCFYRNNVIDPFKINGVPEYNRFITNNSGGADATTPLEIFERNYELDFLTSALPSPQQGIAPLVGFSALGDITVQDEQGNPINASYELAEDSTFTGKVSIHNPAASNAVKSYLSQAGMALAGLSINDFRNVNALQRWLETNIRKGYRYMDFIEGHFGKSPKYNELDMPEFIGGYSRDVNVSQIVQSADMGVVSEDAGTLGSFAGIASCYGGSKHDVTHYCDDYGFIIGMMTIIPSPSYSQLLPKMYLKNSPLDFYFPEFSQLGLQPITYEEVTPLSNYNYNLNHSDAPKPLTDTFGYQRPNYDLVASVDEVHGQFRTTLRDFLIQRYFDERPELGHDFIKIKNDDVSSIFSIRNAEEDNILGQIIFQVYAKRPIPRVVIPSLGH